MLVVGCWRLGLEPRPAAVHSQPPCAPAAQPPTTQPTRPLCCRPAGRTTWSRCRWGGCPRGPWPSRCGRTRFSGRRAPRSMRWPSTATSGDQGAGPAAAAWAGGAALAAPRLLPAAAASAPHPRRRLPPAPPLHAAARSSSRAIRAAAPRAPSPSQVRRGGAALRCGCSACCPAARSLPTPTHPPPTHAPPGLPAAITAGPSGVTAASPVKFEFSTPSGNAAGVRFQCRLGDSNGNVTSSAHRDWAACASPATFEGLPDGAYQFAVRAEVRGRRREAAAGGRGRGREGWIAGVQPNGRALCSQRLPLAPRSQQQLVNECVCFPLSPQRTRTSPRHKTLCWTRSRPAVRQTKCRRCRQLQTAWVPAGVWLCQLLQPYCRRPHPLPLPPPLVDRSKL